MATSDLLSQVGLVSAKSSLSCLDADHLPLLGSLSSLETNVIVTSVTSDLMVDPSPVFSTNVDVTFPSVSKNTSFENRPIPSSLPSWVASNPENIPDSNVALPPVTELRPAVRANNSLDFLGLLTNSGLSLQNNENFLDFPILSKLPTTQLQMPPVSKVKLPVTQKTLNSQAHGPQSSLLLVTPPQSTQSTSLPTSLSQLISSSNNNSVTTNSGVPTSADLPFADGMIPSSADYALGLGGLASGQEGAEGSGQWDTTLSILNGSDGAPKTPNGWHNAGDLLAGTAQGVDLLLSNSVQTYPDIPDNIFAQTVEEIHCYKCKFCPLYISLSKEDAMSHLKSLHSKELVQILPLPNWNTFSQNAAFSLKSSPTTCDTTHYLQGPLLTNTQKFPEGEVEGSFVCGKCQKTFINLQECTRHLASVHHVKSSRIRLEKTTEPAKTTDKVSPDTAKKVSKVKVTPDKDKKAPTTESTVANKKTKKKKPITPMQKFARQKLKREQGCYICEFKGCNVRYQLLDNLEYHRKCHILGGSSFSCPECGTQTERWAPMAGHLWRQHLVDLELNACDQCSFRTYSLTKMENLHKRTHGNERPYQCEICGKKFKTSKQLYNHKMVHEASVTVQDACTICNRKFTEKRMLRVHMDNVHNKVRPFLCNFCGYSASSRSTLKMHLRQHTGEKPFACDKCTYRTADHNSLRRHKMRHSGEKPYKCPYCNYACIQSSTYKEHLKSKHPGLNEGLMFSCTQCSFRTIKQDMFATHMSDHKLDATLAAAVSAQSAVNNATASATVVGDGLLMGEGASPLQEMSLVDALQISIAQPTSLRLLSALTEQKGILPLQGV